MKGIYHIHSQFSDDGKNTIEEISKWGRSQKLKFIIFTEHDWSLDPVKFDSYVSMCKLYSRDIVLIPGVEYSFRTRQKEVHISVLNLLKFLGNNLSMLDASSFLCEVKEMKGISILNHPSDIFSDLSPELIRLVDFIEIWNLKYDPSYAPLLLARPGIFHSVFTKRNIISADLHQIPSQAYPIVEILDRSIQLCQEDILLGLLGKNYLCRYKGWSFTSAGKITSFPFVKKLALLSLAAVHYFAYNFARSIGRRYRIQFSSRLVQILKY